jgi:hypothetical protein
MRVVVGILVALLLLQQVSALGNFTFVINNKTYTSADFSRTYNPYVNITKSAVHAPTYITPFTRSANITINISKVPRELAGVTPQFDQRRAWTFDIPVKFNETDMVNLDPRTCANDLAYCYAVVTNLQNVTPTYGKNYTSVSQVNLPTIRIKTYVCIGNDTACVASATNCFCPKEKVPPPPHIFQNSGKCSATEHLCQSDYGNFVMCKGNLTDCQRKYLVCDCGSSVACSNRKNTCVDARQQLVLCGATIPECLGKFKTCFCGPDMMSFQQGCTSSSHQCVKAGKIYTCGGSLSSCALRFDKCDC